MPIIGTLPNNIANGQSVDATPVMADFNFIVNQVNANANPIGTLTAPSGTRTIFHQAAAPLGWTVDTTITDHTIQVVATVGGGSGGSNAYSGMFNGQWTSDGHALTVGELAAHNHAVNDPGHTHTSPGHNHGTPAGAAFYTNTGGTGNFGGGASTINLEASTATVAVAINAASTGITTANNGSGTAHTHTKTFNANFIQCNVCQKT